MIVMYDAVNVAAIPRRAKAVAGYVDGDWPTFEGLTVRFYGRAHCLSITTRGGSAACLDFEQYDRPYPSIPGAVAWVEAELHAGRWRPCVYANRATWDAGLYRALERYDDRIRRWVADWDGVPEVPAGFDAKQYSTGSAVDVSVCLDSFFPEPATPARHHRRRLPHPHRPAHRVHPKVAAATIAGAIITGLQALLAGHGVAHWRPTPAEASAITACAAVLAAYIKGSGQSAH